MDLWGKALKYFVCDIKLLQNWNGLMRGWAVLEDTSVEDSRSGINTDNGFPEISLKCYTLWLLKNLEKRR